MLSINFASAFGTYSFGIYVLNLCNMPRNLKVVEFRENKLPMTSVPQEKSLLTNIFIIQFQQIFH